MKRLILFSLLLCSSVFAANTILTRVSSVAPAASGGGGGATTNTWVTSYTSANQFQATANNGTLITNGAAQITITALGAFSHASSYQGSLRIGITNVTDGGVFSFITTDVSAADGAFHFSDLTNAVVVGAGKTFAIYYINDDSMDSHRTFVNTAVAQAIDQTYDRVNGQGFGYTNGVGCLNFKYTSP